MKTWKREKEKGRERNWRKRKKEQALARKSLKINRRYKENKMKMLKPKIQLK